MIEIIKEAGVILKDLPDLAIWILIGILFYKVFIIGSSISLAKYAINKLHSFLTKPSEVITIHKYGAHFVNTEAQVGFEELLKSLHGFRFDAHRTYVHESDINLLCDLIKQHKEKKEVKDERK